MEDNLISRCAQNVELCLLILPVINCCCPKMCLNLPTAVPAFILTHPVCCKYPPGFVTHRPCAVTNHPVGYSTELQHTDGELQHTDGELQHTEGELQHTGWVKINAGNAAERCRKFLGKLIVISSISRRSSTFPQVFIFQ
jgi:hypothetical protein